VLLFINAVTYTNNIFHRRGAEGAEKIYFLFAAERPANKMAQALRAKPKSDLGIAQFHVFMNCVYSLRLIFALV
jgi:hypothetical protein